MTKLKNMIINKNKRANIFSVFGVFLIIAISGIINTSIHQTAYAECTKASSSDYEGQNINQIYLSDPCFAERLQDINNTVGVRNEGRQLDEAGFKNLLTECHGGNAGGFLTPTYTMCADAINSCFRKAIDIADCTTDDMAANNLADIAVYCTTGDLNNCGRINTKNLQALNKIKNDAWEKADSACSLRGDTAPERRQSTLDCRKQLEDACPNPPNSNLSSKEFDGYGSTQWQSCFDNTLREMAQNEAECASLSGGKGIWVDKNYQDPVAGSNSNVSKGCKKQYSDLVNEPACTAAGGKWVQTGGADTSKSQDDDYGCVDPSGDPCLGHGGTDPNDPTKCADGTEKDEDDEAAAPITKGDNSVNGTCGEARTNLLDCGDKRGAAAFNEILRIVIYVLTAAIGVAATGGLAWAAILYSKAQDNSGNVSAARELIREIIIGILLYGFLIAIVNWLVPGGIIG